MNRSVIRYLTVGALGAATAVAGFAACRGSNFIAALEPPRISAENEHEILGKGPDSLGGPEGSPVLVEIKPRKTPGLPKPIQTMSDSELVAYLNSLQYDLDTANSEIDSARCVHRRTGLPCGSTEAARVFIEPEVGMHLWKHTDIPRNGLVVARVINYDTTDRAESTFNFPAHRKVWWVVDADSGGNLRSRFFIRNYRANAPAVDTVGIPREFNLCNHLRTTPHPEAKAKFMNCTQSAIYSSSGAGGNAVSRPSALSPAPSLFRSVAFRTTIPVPSHPTIVVLSDTWITCDAGCCSTSR